MKMLRDERGNILALTAVSLTMLLSFMAVAIDVGKLYYTQRQLQTLADAAAMAGALEVSACGGASSSSSCLVLRKAATTALTEGTPSVTPTLFEQCAAASGTGVLLTINNGPCALSGDPNSGNPYYVEAVVTEQVPTYFARFFGVNTLQISARAEAGKATQTSGNGIITNNLTLNGGASIVDATGSTCSLIDNASSGLSTNSGVTINVSAFDYHGTSFNNNCGTCSTYHPMPTTGTPIVPDPYASLTPPSQPSATTTPDYTISGNTTLQPGYYSNTINFNGGSYTVTLNPGLYYFGGGFNADTNVTIQGTGVTLFFPSGANVNMNSSATFNLTAPTSAITGCASCAGMLIWEPSGSLNLDASSSSNWGGAVYLPTGTLTLNGGSTATAYGSIYANSLMVDSAITIGCSGGATNGSTNISLAE